MFGAPNVSSAVVEFLRAAELVRHHGRHLALVVGVGGSGCGEQTSVGRRSWSWRGWRLADSHGSGDSENGHKGAELGPGTQWNLRLNSQGSRDTAEA